MTSHEQSDGCAVRELAPVPGQGVPPVAEDGTHQSSHQHCHHNQHKAAQQDDKAIPERRGGEGRGVRGCEDE